MTFDVDLIVDTVVAAIPKRAEFDDVARAEAGRVVRAAVYGLFPDEWNNKEIRELISGLTNGYGCWLSWLEEAVLDGLSNLPSDGYDPWIKGEIFGSYRLVVRIIEELEFEQYGRGPSAFGSRFSNAINPDKRYHAVKVTPRADGEDDRDFIGYLKHDEDREEWSFYAPEDRPMTGQITITSRKGKPSGRKASP